LAAHHESELHVTYSRFLFIIAISLVGWM